MEAQFKHAQIDKEAAAAETDEAAEALSPEEQVVQLKKLCRRLVITLIALIAVLGLCAGALFYYLTQPQEPPVQGRNYTIDTNTD